MNDNGFYLLGHGRLWVRVLVWQGRGELQGRGLYRSRDLPWGPGVSGCWRGVEVCAVPVLCFAICELYLSRRQTAIFHISGIVLTQTHSPVYTYSPAYTSVWPGFQS